MRVVLSKKHSPASGARVPNDGGALSAPARSTLRRGERGPAIAPPIVADVLRGPGEPLDRDVAGLLEPRFGHDFSHVRIHSDAQAAASAEAVGALAYTVGRSVVFGAGRYAPGTREGRSLIAHELAHVVQQAGAEPPRGEPLGIADEGGDAEREADQMASAAASGRTVASPDRRPLQVARATRAFTLTFDDGPHAAALGKGKNRTENVLDTLKAKGITAAFFVQTGVSFRGAHAVGKKLINRMAKEGHAVGIHTGGTADHEDHPVAEAAGRLEGELKSAKTFIKKETGSAAAFVRPPHGLHNKAVDATYAKVGLTNVLWDIDGDQGKSLSLSALKRNVETGIAAVQSRSWKPSTPSPNIVVLYHDIQANTSKHLADLIDHIKDTTNKKSGGKDTAVFRGL